MYLWFMNWVLHGSSTTFETGLIQIAPDSVLGGGICGQGIGPFIKRLLAKTTKHIELSSQKVVVYEFWIDCYTWDGRTPRGSTVTIFYSKGVAEKNQKIKTGHSVRFKRQAAERFGHISNGIRCTKVQGEDSPRFWAFYNRSFKFHRWVHCFQKEF